MSAGPGTNRPVPTGSRSALFGTQDSGPNPQAPTVEPMGLAHTFAGILVALILLLAAVSAVHYYADYRTTRSDREAAERLNVQLARRAITADLTAVITDLMFLARHMESLSFDPVAAEARRRYLSEVFVTFAREKGLYDQIRYIDNDGMEIVRVNHRDGTAQSVEPNHLQDKSARYYVSRGLALDRERVYVSPLDLNVEGGQIERPFKPVMRLVTSVFDTRGRRQGLLVLNYLGQRLIDDFRQAVEQIADHVYLLNRNGFWLSSPDPAEQWGFMLDRPQTFADRAPQAWSRILREDAGQFATDGHLYSFATVSPARDVSRLLGGGEPGGGNQQVWKLVAELPLVELTISPGGFLVRHAALYLGLLLLLSLMAFLLAHAQTQRRAAEAQRTYEQRFRQTLEEIGLVAVMVDPEGRVSFCNRFLLELTGWRRDEVVGTDWVDRFVPSEQRGSVRDVLRRLDEFPGAFEGEVQTRGGERRLIAWNNTATTDAKGRVLAVTGIGEDITERRQAEAQVRKLSQAVEQSPSIVIITDPGGRIEYVNPKFTEVTGYSFEEVVGKNPRLLKSGETSPDEYRALWSTVARGGEWRGEFHNRRKNGELYWEAASISALRDADGRVSHYLAVKEDITERKRLEREVEQRNRELEREKTLAEMGRMASMIAHDLRNPLSSIKMSVQILARQASNAESAELGAIGLEQIRYMEDIITDMLAYTRPGGLNITWLRTEQLLQAVLNTVQRRIDEYSARVELDCEPGLPTFPGDANKLRQLLSNLLVNALQATEARPPEERRVRIRADRHLGQGGSEIRIRICDNGDGIEPEAQARLFEPFFTTRTKGTGLGLAIVGQIAQQHGGRVSLESNQPRGTCAMLALPVVPKDSVQVVSEPGSNPDGESTATEQPREVSLEPHTGGG